MTHGNSIGIRKQKPYTPNVKQRHVPFKYMPIQDPVCPGWSQDRGKTVFSLSLCTEKHDVRIELNEDTVRELLGFWSKKLNPSETDGLLTISRRNDMQ